MSSCNQRCPSCTAQAHLVSLRNAKYLDINKIAIVAAQKLSSLRLGEHVLHCYMYKLATERVDTKFNPDQDSYNLLFTKSLSNKVLLDVSNISHSSSTPFHQAIELVPFFFLNCVP